MSNVEQETKPYKDLNFLLSSFNVILNSRLDFRNFQGSFNNLLVLIQKKEIDILELALHEIATQLKSHLEGELDINLGSEAVATLAHLILTKTQKLLPEIDVDSDELAECAPFIDHLKEYCFFKEIATELLEREERQKLFFHRHASSPSPPLKHGLDEVSVEDLKTLFSEIISKSAKNAAVVIFEDDWHVENAIRWLKEEIQKQKKMEFESLFYGKKSKEELIVFFLALLELMKNQQLRVAREEKKIYILPHETGS